MYASLLPPIALRQLHPRLYHKRRVMNVVEESVMAGRYSPVRNSATMRSRRPAPFRRRAPFRSMVRFE